MVGIGGLGDTKLTSGIILAEEKGKAGKEDKVCFFSFF